MDYVSQRYKNCLLAKDIASLNRKHSATRSLWVILGYFHFHLCGYMHSYEQCTYISHQKTYMSM
jgi:hypothetical protein